MALRISNGQIEVEVETLGAQMCHLVDLSSEKEYMWSGDEKYWSGISPVLFPIIGGLKNGVTMVDGKAYTMGNHGFARKSDFECIAHGENSVAFRLEESEATKEQYPFDFTLDLTYSLCGRTICIDYLVKNKSEKLMPFQLGTHPAFNLLMGQCHSLSDWYLEFEEAETLERVMIENNLLNLNNKVPIMDHNRILPLHADQFKESAIVLLDIKSRKVILKSDKISEQISVEFENFPDIGIWQPYKAPFLCIEPWYGHGDLIDSSGVLMEKEKTILLSPGDTFNAQLKIGI